MPKIAKELTALEVKHLPTGTHALGGVSGFYLRKKGNGEGHFFLRYSDATGRHDYVLGSLRALSLAEAKKLARDAREKVTCGLSPIETRAEQRATAIAQILEEQKRNQVTTFEQLALEWLKERAENNFWRFNPKGEQDTLNVLRRHVFPFLGPMNAEKITPEDVRDCLGRIWQSKPSTAKKAKTYITKIFQWAIALHKRKNEINPASMQGALGVLMESFQNDRKERHNHAACPVKELPSLMVHIRSLKSISAFAAAFAILTATRSQAVRLARWDEFDLDKGIWQIPLEHDKVKSLKRDRTIFLSTQAIKLLKTVPRVSESSLVFLNNRNTAFSDMALNVFLRGLHEKKKEIDGVGWIDPIKTARLGKESIITIHGTARATFRTWAKDDELGNNRRFDQEAVELCLLHSKEDNYEGAYDRARLEHERRLIMQAWGDYCESLF